MAVALTVDQDDVETLFVQLHITGLTVGTRYDIYRLQLRYLGDNDLGQPVYERELPDRQALWSSLAHRVAWLAPSVDVDVQDYEAPMRPTQYLIVPTTEIGPHEYTDWDTPYPVSRGVLSPTVIDFERDIAQLLSGGVREKGNILVRSTAELGKYISACVVSMEELKYVARGTELAVMGAQYPVYVADTREARRGSVILKVDSLGMYNDLRSIVFPPTGAIRPIVFNAGSEPTMLLDDMRVIPLDITIEQITHNDPSLRYLRIDFVETDPTAPLVQRTGDNDSLIDAPKASFTVSDTTPAKNQWVTLTNTSTGSYEFFDWSIGRGSSNPASKFYTAGPHKVRWGSTGRRTVKLRVHGPAGAHTKSKTVTVH